jgi:cytoskeletal protein CcmA (bactofilin family)
MWRKPTDAKPDVKPSSERPEIRPNVPTAPVAVQAQVTPTPVAASYTPAPAVSAAPVYTAPVTKVVTQDTSAPTSIGAGLKIRGELSGTSDLYIDGEAQGKITLTDSRVTVGVNGRVQADIEAREIIIEGTVQGNLKARESIRLSSSCNVQGSILTPRMVIDDGARLRGKVEMTRAGDAKSSKPSVATEKSAGGSAYKTASASTEREQRTS